MIPAPIASAPVIFQSRPKLRAKLRSRRAALAADERSKATGAALRRLTRLCRFQRARHIALYYPVGAEMDVLALRRGKALRDKTVYLPVVLPGSSARLRFARWDGAMRWRPNRFGISEPICRPASLVLPARLDLVVAPLVGFDAACNRLGAGGGYYDRSFAFRSTRARWRKPYLIGLAFEAQRVASIRSQPWDVKPDAIVTEKQLYLR